MSSFVLFLLAIALSLLFMASDYPFGVFWLPLWCLLITPLVSSDYPFGVFWLPLWCLLITPLVYSDYTFGVFKLSIIPQANTKIFDTCWIIISYYIFRHFLFSTPPYLDVFNGYDYMSQILLATLEKRFSRIWWRRMWT